MNRSIAKARAYYEKVTSEKDAFYYSDFMQLIEKSKEVAGDPIEMIIPGRENVKYYYNIIHLWEGITGALEAGYAIGYRAAKRQSKSERR